MRTKELFIAVVCACVAPVAGAQFLGDALAAGGVAITEAEALGVIAASKGITPPAVGGTVQSGDPQSAPVYTPETLGTDVGLRRGGPTAAAGGTAPSSAPGAVSSTTTTSSIQQPPVGGSTGIAGAALHASTVDPVELAAWQGAMIPVGGTVKKLSPTGMSVTAGGRTLSYDKGVFYEKKGAEFVAVPAPVGASVPQKPVGSSTVFAGGKPFIYYFGTFYVYDGAQRAYVVTAPPAGAKVDYLPDTAKKVEWQGAAHFQYAGTYYKPWYQGSKLVFEVAGTL